MFQWIREKLGVGGAAFICLIAVALAVWAVVSRKDPAVVDASQRVYICAETMKTFNHTLAEGEKSPVYSPYSKKNTGYPAERCYWTRDGGVKRTPTYVLLNEYVGKEGPTICPDCGRKVVARNPLPPAEKLKELAQQQDANKAND